MKSVDDYQRMETCKVCNGELRRLFSSPILSVDKTQAEFNPAFGKVIKSKYHRSEEAKARGWVELGNENVDKISSKFEKDRDTKRQRSWDSVEI